LYRNKPSKYIHVKYPFHHSRCVGGRTIGYSHQIKHCHYLNKNPVGDKPVGFSAFVNFLTKGTENGTFRRRNHHSPKRQQGIPAILSIPGSANQLLYWTLSGAT
jgi:hypothetical protein